MEDEKFSVVKDGTVDTIKEEVDKAVKENTDTTITSKVKSILVGIKNAILPIKERDVIFFIVGAFVYAFIHDFI